MLTRSKVAQDKPKVEEDKKRRPTKEGNKRPALAEVNENEPNRGSGRRGKRLRPAESKQAPKPRGLTLRPNPRAFKSSVLSPLRETHGGRKRRTTRNSGAQRVAPNIVTVEDEHTLSDSLFSKAELEEALLEYERQQGYEDGNDNSKDIGEFGFNAFKHREVLKQREHMYLPKQNYLSWHPSLTPKTRVILVSWLIEVAEEFRFQRETLHMAVNYVDRFLSCVPRLCRSKFQLIGVAALFIACKIEEQVWPALSTLTQLTDGACTNDDVLQMEQLVLQKLSWHMLPITPNTFLRLYLYTLTKYNVEAVPAKALIADKTQDIASPDILAEASEIAIVTMKFPKKEYVYMMNILDTATLDYSSIKYTPSMIAASVLFLVYLQDVSKIEYVTGYTEEELTLCVEWVKPYMKVSPPKAYTSPVELLPSDFYNYQISNPLSKKFVESYL